MMSVFLMVLALVGCKGEGEPTVPTDLVFVTYNAGLAEGFVPGTESRVPYVADALAEVDADFLCLQEVWQAGHADTIKAKLNGFDEVIIPSASQSSDAQCLEGEIDSLVTCVEDNCAEATCSDEVTECAVDNCGVTLAFLPKDCMRCAMANVGLDAQEIADTCGTDPVEYAYDGSFGLVFASKHPLSNVTETVFESTSNRRMVITATASTPDGDIDVSCTHLTSVFSTIPYPRAEGGWEEEQLVQIEELVAMANASSNPVVMMGDFNTGPGVGSIQPEVGTHYAKLRDDGGLTNSFLADAVCTYCSTNPLVASDDSSDRVIDHVLFKGLESSDAHRILDQDSPTQTCGTDLNPGALSDHYGLSVTLAFPVEGE